MSIPVLSLASFRSGTAAERDRFAHTLGEALREVGFFALDAHGIDPALVRAAYDKSKAFFLLDEADKRACEDGALGQRGFVRFGKEKAKDRTANDLKEFFHVGPELDADDPLLDVYGHNLWPAAPDGFRTSMTALWSALDEVAQRLLEACAMYLGEDRRRFADMATRGDTVLRLIHYPPLGPDTPAGAMRAAEHEDINFITLLCEATESGLEIQGRDGQWLPVKAAPGQFIVDSGDMLQHLTNGVFKSTTHRVVNPDDMTSRRFSMPFFVHPRADVDLTPLPSCVARQGGESRYPAVTARQLLEERLRAIGMGPDTDHAR